MVARLKQFLTKVHHHQANPLILLLVMPTVHVKCTSDDNVYQIPAKEKKKSLHSLTSGFRCRLFHSKLRMTNGICQVGVMLERYHSNKSPGGMVGKVAVGVTSCPFIH